MTIAAGFVCTDGLVLCADTEYSNGALKVSKSKIFKRQQQDLLIAASGDEVLIEEAASTLLESLDETLSLDHVKETIEHVMDAMHANYIDSSPDPDYTVHLLVAAKARDGFALFKQSRWAATEVHSPALKSKPYAVIGSGSGFGHYVAERLYGDAPRETMVARIVSVHVLQLAKQYVDGCGGKSEVYVLPVPGWAYKDTEMNASRLETYFTAVNAALRPLMLAIPNPNVSAEEVEERLKNFCDGIKATRPIPFDLTLQLGETIHTTLMLMGQTFTTTVMPTEKKPQKDSVAQPDPPTPTDDPKGQPPSPE
jgi:hypothetical protein